MFGLVPFGARKDLARQNDGFRSLFDVFNEPFFHEDFMPAFTQNTMKVDVRDTGDAYELTADLPGVKKEDLKLSYENSYLTIAAQSHEEKDEKDEKGGYIRRERRSGAVSRSFYIDDIDDTKVSAEFKDGVLKVMMPKAQVTQVAKTIEIK